MQHRAPVPRGFLPKVRHYTRNIPRPNMTIVIVLCLGLLVWPAARFAQTSEYFRVNNWNIQGLDILTETEIMWLMSLEKDDRPNIFAFDGGEAESGIQNHSGVLHAVTHKQFPNQINIYVYERKPEAILVTDKDMLLVDLEGIAYAKAKAENLLESSLPVLTIADGAGMSIGDTVPESFLMQALLYERTLRESGSPLALELSEYHLTPAAGLEIILRNGITLKCGSRSPSETIPKYHALLRSLDHQPSMRYADLRLDTHVPWQPGAARSLPSARADEFARAQ